MTLQELHDKMDLIIEEFTNCLIFPLQSSQSSLVTAISLYEDAQFEIKRAIEIERALES